MKTFRIGLTPVGYTSLHWFEIEGDDERQAIAEAVTAAKKHFGFNSWKVYRYWEV